MAQTEEVLVLAPAHDEGTRATVLRWCKQVGDAVAKDEPLVELETDKVTVEIPAPAGGILIEVLKPAGTDVAPDDVLARLSVGGGSARPEGVSASAARAPAAFTPSPAAFTPSPAADTAAAREALLSPAVRRLLAEHSLAPAAVRGTGRDGRVTAQDVMRHAASPANSRLPHTAIRRRVAEHMTRSLSEAPHVTTLFEADLTRVLAHRARHAGDYAARGSRLTLTAYFISACARALIDHPQVNATFHEDGLEVHSDVNIGVGIALGDQGLIVPVIHGAPGLDLFESAQRLATLVEAARAGKLAPADVRGGTFTISNHGVGGSLLAAPIVINQPQVAILGIGKVERRVCVVHGDADADGGEAIGVRSKCYLTLTIDHRALDAFQANAFLGSLVRILAEWPAEEG